MSNVGKYYVGKNTGKEAKYTGEVIEANKFQLKVTN